MSYGTSRSSVHVDIIKEIVEKGFIEFLTLVLKNHDDEEILITTLCALENILINGKGLDLCDFEENPYLETFEKSEGMKFLNILQKNGNDKVNKQIEDFIEKLFVSEVSD